MSTPITQNQCRWKYFSSFSLRAHKLSGARQNKTPSCFAWLLLHLNVVCLWSPAGSPPPPRHCLSWQPEALLQPRSHTRTPPSSEKTTRLWMKPQHGASCTKRWLYANKLTNYQAIWWLQKSLLKVPYYAKLNWASRIMGLQQVFHLFIGSICRECKDKMTQFWN